MNSSLSPFSFDEDDNMYFTGYLELGLSGGFGDTLHQYPVHIYWDSRLKAKTTTKTGAFGQFGEAVDLLQKSCENIGDNGVFITAVDSTDSGKTGTIYTLEFELPANVKAGDVFPIDIAYSFNKEYNFTCFWL